MFTRLSTFGLTGLAATLVSFGIDAQAIAQTTYDFSITYTTEFSFPPLEQELQPQVVNISQLLQNLPPRFTAALPEGLPSELTNPTILDVSVIGESGDSNVPFGLTNFTSKTVGLPLPPQIDAVTGQITRQVSVFRANPADLNVKAPQLFDMYFGEGTDNKLIGQANDQALFDFVQGTVEGEGVITVVGGEGIFEGASGKINFTQKDVLGAPGESIKGEAKLDFFIQTPQAVPEPGTEATLAGLGLLGTGFLLRRHRQK